jgi:DNA-binding protein HU-beta
LRERSVLRRRRIGFDRMQCGRRFLLRLPKTADRRRRLSNDRIRSPIRGRMSCESIQERKENRMSKAFIAQVIQDSASLTGTAANRAAADLMGAIVRELKKNGKFTLPSFGTFSVRKTRARKGLNPRTGESIKVKAGKTVRFKASPTLKKAV